MTRGRVVVVLDRHDDADSTRRALAAHRPAAGVITVHPTPSVTSTRTLADDVLLALGASAAALTTAPIPRAEDALWRVAAARITGNRIRRIAVLRGHRFTAARWNALLGLQQTTDTSLMVLCAGAGLPSAATTALSRVPHEVTDDLGQIARLLQPELPGGEDDALDALVRTAPPVPEDFPDLPRSAMHRFRADAFRQLEPEQFAAADAQYRFARDAACAWITTRPQYTETTRAAAYLAPALLPSYLTAREASTAEKFLIASFDERPGRALFAGLLCIGRDPLPRRRYPVAWRDPQDLHAFLCALAASSTSPAATLARVRGAQAGFLLHGLLLSVPENLAIHAGPGLSTAVLSERLCAHLAAYSPHPAPAAALVLSAVTGLEIERAAAIRVDGIEPTGARIHYEGCYTVPAPARALLRTARTLRVLEGAADDAHLLSGKSWRAAAARLRESAARECGFAPPPGHARERYRPWHLHSELFFVADPLHGPRPDDPEYGRGR